MDMRKMAGVFVIAVLVPTLVLAWLSIRSLRDQEIVANSQRAVLHQSSTEALAADVNTFMDDVRVFFDQLINDLVAEVDPIELTTQFDRIAPERWSQCSVACVVTDRGQILCPTPSTENPVEQAFLKLNAPFLLNQSAARFYDAGPISNTGPLVKENRVSKSKVPQKQISNVKLTTKEQAIPQVKVEVSEQKLKSNNPFRRMQGTNDYRQTEVASSKSESIYSQSPIERNVYPSQQIVDLDTLQIDDGDNASRLAWGIGNIKDLIEEKNDGAVSRFLQDGLHVLLWKRHPQIRERIFWVELDLDEIKNDLNKIVSGYSDTDICLCLLDAEGNVVSKTIPEFSSDWSKPFVASEVGQVLPHWEVAAYLLDPAAVNRSARTAKLMIWLLVPTLLSAIGIGTFLIFRSIGIEMRLARQKTDFVSNVSHELRTPLTSIRMFSDLLTAEAKSEKDREYSGIISREAARLTRLINNLLSFSRLERSEIPFQKEPIDLAELTCETVETYRMQLEAEGHRLVYEPLTPEHNLTVQGDRDALSQVLLNLLSNAEKYGSRDEDRNEIRVRLNVYLSQNRAEWEVLDRGPGIDRRHISKIFEKFYRVDDSLTNGVQGSGLGLALAQQIVAFHEGKISYKSRPGGGSCFIVSLPITTT